MNSNDKIDKILKENPEIWKTESAYFSYIRGCIRLAWSKNPVKLKLLKKVKKQIPNPNYGKPRNTKPTVMGATCEICNNDFPMKLIEIDHRHGGTYSLRCVDDIQNFFENVCIVTEDDLRVVCKGCHGCLTYSAKMNISFEEAKKTKDYILTSKSDEKVIEALLSFGAVVNEIPKTKIGRKNLLKELTFKEVNGD